jgi:hemerythrin-like domain-containing protein
LEIWIKQHRLAIEHADRLAELLSPADVQARLIDQAQKEFRDKVMGHLEALVEMANGHFRQEEKLLVPAIMKYLDANDPKVSRALGCLAREHAQVHKSAERIGELLPKMKSDEPLLPAEAAELLRLAFGIQSLVRYHSLNEEREVYPLVGRLPVQVIDAIMTEIGDSPDLPIDHLVRPLGEGECGGYPIAPEGEGPEN